MRRVRLARGPAELSAVVPVVAMAVLLGCDTIEEREPASGGRGLALAAAESAGDAPGMSGAGPGGVDIDGTAGAEGASGSGAEGAGQRASPRDAGEDRGPGGGAESESESGAEATATRDREGSSARFDERDLRREVAVDEDRRALAIEGIRPDETARLDPSGEPRRHDVDAIPASEMVEAKSVEDLRDEQEVRRLTLFDLWGFRWRVIYSSVCDPWEDDYFIVPVGEPGLRGEP